MSRTAQVLRQNAVFNRASDAALEQLVSRSSLMRYGPGDVVLRENEPAQRVFALLEGRVRVYLVSPNGDEVVAKLFGAPAIFGEAEALGGFPYQEYVNAIEESQILVMPIEVFTRFLREDKTAAFRMLVDVAMRLGIAAYNQKALAFHPATMRLAGYLVDYATWTNPPGSTEWLIELTQDQMASAVGVTRRSVAKDMADWKAAGIITRRGDHYVIKDLPALERYCDSERLRICYDVNQIPLFEE